MKRRSLKPSPVLVSTLVAVWLLLNQTLAPGQVLLGLLLALGVGWAASALRPLRPRLQRVDLAAGLFFAVMRDVVRSNLAVATIVLGLAAGRAPRSGFVQIPIGLRDPHGLATLAIIVTSTPGAVWVGLSPGGDTLTLHVLDLRDESEWIELIQQRYEAPLRRIFE